VCARSYDRRAGDVHCHLNQIGEERNFSSCPSEENALRFIQEVVAHNPRALWVGTHLYLNMEMLRE
jgi:hypothetical protein